MGAAPPHPEARGALLPEPRGGDMAQLPLHQCSRPGCTTLTRHPRCEQHAQRQPQTDTRPTAHNRGYSAIHRRLRHAYLSTPDGSVCAHCKRYGQFVPSEVLHHIDGNQHNRTESNLLGLCRAHHEALHGRKHIYRPEEATA